MTRRASCSCGRLRVVCRAEPLRVSVCHCLACKQRTGSAFGVQARFDARDVEIEGESTAFTRVADSGNEVTFHFCATCGSTVFWRLGELVAIAVGAFADPGFPEPTFSVYEARQHSWVRLAPTCELERWD
ncbi:MAG: GFA family protein [Deltaproteobacteria bacterium]|nr:GFA family protein [Deltaproteobacteria bacterium]